jgi:hypothetical protein
MIQNKYWFSLIEVVIATSIITITVFWVYKLIWENTKIITNSSNYLQVHSLFPVLENCLDNLWYSKFPIKETYRFYLWSSWSLKWCSKNNLWVVVIDNINYILKSKMLEKGSNYINWELQISSEETNTMTWFYRQIKK